MQFLLVNFSLNIENCYLFVFEVLRSSKVRHLRRFCRLHNFRHNHFTIRHYRISIFGLKGLSHTFCMNYLILKTSIRIFVSPNKQDLNRQNRSHKGRFLSRFLNPPIHLGGRENPTESAGGNIARRIIARQPLSSSVKLARL